MDTFTVNQANPGKKPYFTLRMFCDEVERFYDAFHSGRRCSNYREILAKYEYDHTNTELEAELHAILKSNVEDLLTEFLHGSGWNYKWHVTRTKDGYIARIDYDAMNENGYYDGVFTVVNYISKDFQLKRQTFDATRTERRKYITYQSDYYWECVHDALNDIREELLQRMMHEQTELYSKFQTVE